MLDETLKYRSRSSRYDVILIIFKIGLGINILGDSVNLFPLIMDFKFLFRMTARLPKRSQGAGEFTFWEHGNKSR